MQATKSDSKNSLQQFYSKRGALLATALVVFVGGLLAVMLLLPRGERIDKDGYQVVYMTSGQAYFGKLQNADGTYLKLTTPYIAQNVTPVGEKASSAQPVSTTLVKVSQQTYGPDDVISLSKDQVLFWQNLRSDSKVVKAIRSNQ